MILVNIQLAPDLPAQRLETLKAAERALDDPVSEECGAFLEASRGERLEALYILAVTTGMRRGELLGLKWSDVDVENATVSIRRTFTRTDNGKRVSLGEPKTKKSRRTVRLTQRAIEALRSHRARQAEEKLKAGSLYQDQGLVFADEAGGFINLSNLRQRSFTPLLKRADLPQITFHDLGHTCASLLFQRNVHPKLLQELLGHSSVAITSTPTATCCPAWAAKPPTRWARPWARAVRINC